MGARVNFPLTLDIAVQGSSGADVRVVPRDEPMPRTVNAIIQRLREAGSWRVKA